MIEFKNVSASYDTETPILRDVSFTINDGDFIAFVGTNGAGKSTTMRLCNGLLKPTAGSVLVDGVSTADQRVSQLARRVGFLFQNPDRQICCATVREELLFGLRTQLGEVDEAVEARVDAILERLGLEGSAEPYLLNRGSRQLLALASVVVLDTPVVILDEPTTGLDFRECKAVMDLVAQLHERGRTIVMVCHDMEVVADYAKRVVVMTRGRVVADGPTFEVLRDASVLLEADLVPPQVVDVSLRIAADMPHLAESAVGRANTLDDMVAAVLSAKGGEPAGLATEHEEG